MLRNYHRGLLVVLVAMMSTAVAGSTFAAPKSKNSKKARAQETTVTRTAPTDAQKADVEDWLASHLDNPNYEIVRWGDVVQTEIGDTTRTGIELKYRAVNKFGALELHDSLFLLDDNGTVFGEQGPAAFEWQNAMIESSRQYREGVSAKKSKAAKRAQAKEKPKKNPPPVDPRRKPAGKKQRELAGKRAEKNARADKEQQAQKFIQDCLTELEAPDPNKRARAAQRLRNSIFTDFDNAGPALVAALEDVSDIVRCEAIKALGALGSSAAPCVPVLIERCKANATGDQRRLLFEAIGKIGSEDAVDYLITVVKVEPEAFRGVRRRPDPTDPRSAAIDALRTIGPAADRAIPDLLAVLDSSASSLQLESAIFVATTEAIAAIAPRSLEVRNALDKYRKADAFPVSEGRNGRGRDAQIAAARTAADTAWRQATQVEPDPSE